MKRLSYIEDARCLKVEISGRAKWLGLLLSRFIYVGVLAFEYSLRIRYLVTLKLNGLASNI